MEWLAGRLPPEALRRQIPRGRDALDALSGLAGLGEHDESCGSECGHSHSPSATILPLHASEKIGRNDLCPCGSGRKHKRCCGK
jgi:hypothetical protein